MCPFGGLVIYWEAGIVRTIVRLLVLWVWANDWMNASQDKHFPDESSRPILQCICASAHMRGQSRDKRHKHDPHQPSTDVRTGACKQTYIETCNLNVVQTNISNYGKTSTISAQCQVTHKKCSRISFRYNYSVVKRIGKNPKKEKKLFTFAFFVSNQSVIYKTLDWKLMVLLL